MILPCTLLSTGLSIVCSLIIAGCSRDEAIRIGIVVGADGMKGARLAAESLNAAGGVRGRPVELVVLEGQWLTSAEMAIRAADSLSGRRDILAVIGHANSSASLAAAQVYNANRVVQIAPNSTSPLMRSAGPYTYRMVGSDAGQASFLVSELVRRGRPRTALFYVNDDYGRPLHDSVAMLAARAGVPIVLDLPYVELEAFEDRRAIADTLARLEPGVVLWLGRALDLEKVLNEVRPHAPGLDVVASDGIGAVCCEVDRLKRALAGVSYARLIDPSSQSADLAALRERYSGARDGFISDQAALTYDAVLLLGRAIEEGGANREAIRRYLDRLAATQTPFHGAAGTTVFDSAGDARGAYYLDTVRGGAQ